MPKPRRHHHNRHRPGDVAARPPGETRRDAPKPERAKANKFRNRTAPTSALGRLDARRWTA